MNDLFKIGEAATLLGVSVATLRNWDKSGKLKNVRTAFGHRRYRIEDIKRFKKGVVLDTTPTAQAAHCEHVVIDPQTNVPVVTVRIEFSCRGGE